MWLYADIQNVPEIVRHYGRVTPDKMALLEGSFSLMSMRLIMYEGSVINAQLRKRVLREKHGVPA